MLVRGPVGSELIETGDASRVSLGKEKRCVGIRRMALALCYGALRTCPSMCPPRNATYRFAAICGYPAIRMLHSRSRWPPSIPEKCPIVVSLLNSVPGHLFASKRSYVPAVTQFVFIVLGLRHFRSLPFIVVHACLAINILDFIRPTVVMDLHDASRPESLRSMQPVTSSNQEASSIAATATYNRSS